MVSDVLISPHMPYFLLLFSFLNAADPPAVPITSTTSSIQSVTIHGTHHFVALETQVGAPYNARVIDEDVHRMWKTGRFDDIKVETKAEADGTAVIFNVHEAPQVKLRKLLIEPSTYGLKLPLREGESMTSLQAQSAAIAARKQLNDQGFENARVDYTLVPASSNQADLHIRVEPGDRVRVKQIRFTGDPGLPTKQLRKSLQAFRTRRILAWRILPTYTPDAAASDASRLRSLYLLKGYFDASVRVDETSIQGKDARVDFRIESGTPYHVPGPANVCEVAFAARRDAERQGILDFSATLNVHREGDAVVDTSLDFRRGRPYHVGRIDFSGNRHYSDATLRRSLLLEEGALFDEYRLRKSIARLNQAQLFDPMNEDNVAIHGDPETGIADINIRVRERQGHAWNISGPVGPASIGGPLEASLTSRLPSWGAGLLQLSTYTVSLSMFAFDGPLLSLISGSSKNFLFPIFAVRRPYLPGEGLTSGFLFAPQLGWRIAGLHYVVMQMQQRLLPALNGNRGLVPELRVEVADPKGDGVIYCDPPGPRLAPLRTTAGILLRLAGTFVAF